MRITLLLIAALGLYGQEQAASRQEEIEAARREKASSLSPTTPSRAEFYFTHISKNELVDKIFGGKMGWGLKIGGLPTGSGFALGPRYFRPDLAGENIVFKAWAVASAGKFYQVATSIGMPHLLRERATIEFTAARNDSPAIEYYGSGPKSLASNRSSFRREQTDFHFTAGLRPIRRYLTAGFEAGVMQLNIGPGARAGIPSADRLFTPAASPGIQNQTSYGRLGPVATLDTRDMPRDPHQGTLFEAKYLFYKGLDLEQFSFQKVSGTAEHYIPFLNAKRIIALRAATEWNLVDRRHAVPFYMQATLGGSDDLRGYPRFRFYDDNSMAASVEYRWEVMPAIDLAAFADAGQVYSKRNRFNWDEMRGAGGFGVRLKNRNAVAVRLDAGFSREGFQIWLKFGNTF